MPQQELSVETFEEQKLQSESDLLEPPSAKEVVSNRQNRDSSNSNESRGSSVFDQDKNGVT